MIFVEDCKRVAASAVREWLEYDGRNGPWEHIGAQQGLLSIRRTERDDEIALDEQQVRLTWVPGVQGQRLFFLCPACGNRCTKLYLPPNDSILACRTCWDLPYRSQHTPKKVQFWKKREEYLKIVNDLRIRPDVRRNTWPKLNKVERQLFPDMPTTREQLDWAHQRRIDEKMAQLEDARARGLSDETYEMAKAQLQRYSIKPDDAGKEDVA